MQRLRHTASVVLALFALQAGATAASAAAAVAPCCPMMVQASPSEPGPPCRSLAPVGCCEELAVPLSDARATPSAPSVTPLPVPAWSAAVAFSAPPALVSPLRSVILRL
jgi:hypothetical protein